MCEVATYHKIDVFAQAKNLDPTRTKTLRDAFVRDMNRRFNELLTLIRTAIIIEDVFALKTKESNLIAQQGFSPGRRAFDFSTNAQKVDAFMSWLNEQIGAGILETKQFIQLGTAIEGAWTNQYVYDSYKRGVLRGRLELNKAGFKIPTIEETGGIEASFNTPFHMDRVGVLYSRVYSDLKGITAAMDQNISRVLAQGMIDGDGPALLARKIASTIGKGLDLTDSLGRFIPARRRAQILARTEVIRAHHRGMIQEYKNWGAAGVVVKAEFRTAGDDRVCPECQPLESEIFDLKTAETLIPIHPQCRCITLPFRAGDTPLPKQFDADGDVI